MLRSVVQLLKGQRVSSAVVDDEPPAPNRDIAQGSETHPTQDVLGVVNPDLAPLREERRQAEESFRWVKVDLSPVLSGDIREDACKVQLKVVGMDHSADCVKLDVREAGGPSSSNSLDASLTDKRSITTEISTDLQHQLQQHSITITVQMPPPRQSSLDPCKAQETGVIRTISGMSTDSMAEHCRRVFYDGKSLSGLHNQDMDGAAQQKLDLGNHLLCIEALSRVGLCQQMKLSDWVHGACFEITSRMEAAAILF